MISEHEFGGDPDSDILRDADSISFFEGNLEYYFKRMGEEKTRHKIRFMYQRMSGKARSMVKKFRYGDTKLDSIFREIIS